MGQSSSCCSSAVPAAPAAPLPHLHRPQPLLPGQERDRGAQDTAAHAAGDGFSPVLSKQGQSRAPVHVQSSPQGCRQQRPALPVLGHGTGTHRAPLPFPCPVWNILRILLGIFFCFVCASLSSSLYVCFSFTYQHHRPTFMRLAPGPTVQAHTFTSARKNRRKKNKNKRRKYI